MFSGYLLQPLHCTAVVFPCLLHGSIVVNWGFQVSFGDVFFRGFAILFNIFSICLSILRTKLLCVVTIFCRNYITDYISSS